MKKVTNYLFNSVKLCFLTISTFLIILALNHTVFALDPNKALTQYTIDQWQDELPQNTVMAITQTPDGYMWFGTYEGLVRFDGVSFYNFNRYNTAAILSNAIYTLYVDSKGYLWFGTGEGVVCFKDNKFNSYTTKEGLIHNVVRAIFEDLEGNIWFGSEKGVSCFSQGKFINHSIVENTISSKRTNIICQDKNGKLWFGTEKGLISISLKDNESIIYTTKGGLTNNFVLSLCFVDENELWVGTIDGLNYLKEEKFVESKVRNVLSKGRIEKIYQDSYKNVWIGTETRGLYRLQENSLDQLTSKQGLTHDNIRSFYIDKEGSIWIGTNSGLNRLKNSIFTNYSTKEGMSSDNTRAVCESKKGGIWIGTEGGGLNFLKDGKIIVYGAKEGLFNTFIRALYEDNAGRLWVGTSAGLGFLQNGVFTIYNSGSFPELSTNAILKDSKGNLWIGTNTNGLFCFKDNENTNYTIKNNLNNNGIRALFEDRDGNLWVGTRAGINVFRDGKLINYSASNNQISGFAVFTFYQDKEGVLWIGTERGLFWLKDSKLFSCGKNQGLFDDIVFQVLESNDGSFWMSSNKGIFRVLKKDLNSYEKGIIQSISCTAYNKLDGMPTNQCNGATQPAGWKDKNGKLWFPTIKGLTMIDPENIKINKLVPSVVIEQMMIDGQKLDPKENISLEPGKQNFEIYYNGLSFISPQKVRFRYKLEGYDKDWKEVTRRIAYYTNLNPGDYEFKVVACNNDGIWNQIGASFRFHIKTPVLQTRGAYVFYVFFGITIIYFAFLISLQTLKRQNERLEANVVGRTIQLNKRNDQLKEKAGELNKKNDELAEKIQELNSLVEKIRLSEEFALEVKNKALESEKKALEANHFKSVFLSNMSHELRTPLNAIIGFAQLMERDKGLNSNQVERLGIITRSGEHLLGLINDVLSLAKIEAGKITLNEQKFDLQKLLKDIEEMMKVRVQPKNLKLNFYIDSNLPKYVLGDEGKLRQILINLLGNAAKFTEKGSVALRVSWKEGIADFEVEDTGIGINKGEVGKLFQPFTQTKSGCKAKEGTGLGLALSKNFIQLMGGDITLKSELNKGTTFNFFIKLVESSEVEPNVKKQKVVSLKADEPQYKILIVDDKLENRKLLVELLSPLSFQISQASDGQEAFEIWQKHHPHFIWMDMRMPVVDGYLATKNIREAEKNNGYSKTIIVALTASAFDHEQKSILEIGCDDFVLKPFQEKEIFDKLSQYLGVKFQYEEILPISNKEEVIKTALSDERFKSLPNDILIELTDSLNVGDNQMAQSVVKKITELDKDLATEINNRIKSFQVDELLDILEKVVV